MMVVGAVVTMPLVMVVVGAVLTHPTCDGGGRVGAVVTTPKEK